MGFVGNAAVAVYRIRTGRRIGSAALIAKDPHARADGYTSIAVVAGVWLDFPRADAIAGLLIAVAITGILVNSLVIITRRLMDGVEPDAVERMRATIAGVAGVEVVGEVRARWAGHRMEGDAEIGVDFGLSLLQAHDVAENVQHSLMHVLGNLDRVIVHVNPTFGGGGARQAARAVWSPRLRSGAPAYRAGLADQHSVDIGCGSANGGRSRIIRTVPGVAGSCRAVGRSWLNAPRGAAVSTTGRAVRTRKLERRARASGLWPEPGDRVEDRPGGWTPTP